MAHNKFYDDDDDKAERIGWRTESGRRGWRGSGRRCYGRRRGRYKQRLARAAQFRVSVVIDNQLLVLPTVFNVHPWSFKTYVTQGSLPGCMWKLKCGVWIT